MGNFYIRTRSDLVYNRLAPLLYDGYKGCTSRKAKPFQEYSSVLCVAAKCHFDATSDTLLPGLAFIAFWGIVLFGYDTCVHFVSTEHSPKRTHRNPFSGVAYDSTFILHATSLTPVNQRWCRWSSLLCQVLWLAPPGWDKECQTNKCSAVQCCLCPASRCILWCIE